MISRKELRELCFKKMEQLGLYCNDIVEMSEQLAEDMNILEIKTLFDVLTRSDNEEQYDSEFVGESYY